MLTVSLPDADWVRRVGDIDGARIVVDPVDGASPVDPSVEVMVPPYMGGFDVTAFARYPRLRLVQLLSAGFDGLVTHLPPGVQLANAAGVHDASTAEIALTLLLAAQRGIPDFVRAQERGEWLVPDGLPTLADHHVVVVGYGGVGTAVARRLAPFECAVTAVASRARAGDGVVGTVHGVDELDRLLPKADVVVVTVPLDESTRGLVDDAFLARMPDGGLLVNVARGAVADTEALLRHAGRLRLALDVTDPEPLPRDHALWQAPGVLISPHTGGATTAFAPRATAMLRAQLTRLAKGEPPQHVVAG